MWWRKFNVSTVYKDNGRFLERASFARAFFEAIPEDGVATITSVKKNSRYRGKDNQAT